MTDDRFKAAQLDDPIPAYSSLADSDP